MKDVRWKEVGGEMRDGERSEMKGMWGVTTYVNACKQTCGLMLLNVKVSSIAFCDSPTYSMSFAGTR